MNERPDAEGASQATRRPYQKPAVAWEETLVERPGLMAACGKMAGQSTQCDSVPTS